MELGTPRAAQVPRVKEPHYCPEAGETHLGHPRASARKHGSPFLVWVTQGQIRRRRKSLEGGTGKSQMADWSSVSNRKLRTWKETWAPGPSSRLPRISLGQSVLGHPGLCRYNRAAKRPNNAFSQ